MVTSQLNLPHNNTNSSNFPFFFLSFCLFKSSWVEANMTLSNSSEILPRDKIAFKAFTNLSSWTVSQSNKPFISLSPSPETGPARNALKRKCQNARKAKRPQPRTKRWHERKHCWSEPFSHWLTSAALTRNTFWSSHCSLWASAQRQTQPIIATRSLVAV